MISTNTLTQKKSQVIVQLDIPAQLFNSLQFSIKYMTSTDTKFTPSLRWLPAWSWATRSARGQQLTNKFPKNGCRCLRSGPRSSTSRTSWRVAVTLLALWRMTTNHKSLGCPAQLPSLQNNFSKQAVPSLSYTGASGASSSTTSKRCSSPISLVSSSQKEYFPGAMFENFMEIFETCSGHTVITSEVSFAQLAADLFLERRLIPLWLFAVGSFLAVQDPVDTIQTQNVHLNKEKIHKRDGIDRILVGSLVDSQLGDYIAISLPTSATTPTSGHNYRLSTIDFSPFLFWVYLWGVEERADFLIFNFENPDHQLLTFHFSLFTFYFWEYLHELSKRSWVPLLSTESCFAKNCVTQNFDIVKPQSSDKQLLVNTTSKYETRDGKLTTSRLQVYFVWLHYLSSSTRKNLAHVPFEVACLTQLWLLLQFRDARCASDADLSRESVCVNDRASVQRTTTLISLHWAKDSSCVHFH